MIRTAWFILKEIITFSTRQMKTVWMEAWGHYATKDFQTYTRHATAVSPDSKYDKNGAYSGSAIIRDDILYVFYTGNVKYEGPYDFIHEGREHNVMRVESL